MFLISNVFKDKNNICIMAKKCSNCKGQIATRGNYVEADGKVYCLVCATKVKAKKK